MKRSGYLSSPKKLQDTVPQDTYGLFYLLVFIQGIGSLFPWNVLVTAQDYYRARLAGSAHAQGFITNFAIIFMTIKFLFLVAVVFFFKRMKPSMQVFIALLGNAIVFVALTLLCKWTDLDVNHFYIITLALVVLAALFAAFAENGLYALLGPFDAHFTQGFIAGQALAGVTVCLNVILSISFTHTPEAFAFTYFGISAVVIFVSWLCFLKILWHPYYQHHALGRVSDIEQDQSKSQGSTFAQIFSRIRNMALAVFLTCWINLTIFPTFVSITSSTAMGTSAATMFHTKYFSPIAFMTFNLGDLIGKVIPSVKILSFRHAPFFTLACARLLFLPIFLLGNLQLFGMRLPFKAILANDILFYLAVFLLALTGGYLGTLVMMWAPACMIGVGDSGRAASVMVFFLMAGLVGGAYTAQVILTLLQAYSTKIA